MQSENSSCFDYRDAFQEGDSWRYGTITRAALDLKDFDRAQVIVIKPLAAARERIRVKLEKTFEWVRFILLKAAPILDIWRS